MKAIVQDRYGLDALELRAVDVPTPTDTQVLVSVRAAGLDPGVWHLATGLPYLVRLGGFGVRAPKTPIPGSDFAGVVEAVGDAVTDLRPGDEVFGVGKGTFAEHAVAEAAHVALKPADLDWEGAAAVPTSGVVALQALRDHARVRTHESVLIIGAAGGVGSFAVQIAKTLGAAVTGVCSTSKVDLVRSLGADRVIDYTEHDFTDGPELFDVIVDTAGNRPLRRLRHALTPRGTLVIVGGEDGGRWLGGTQRQVGALFTSPFVRQRLRSFIAKTSTDDLTALQQLMAAGRLRPVIDRTCDLTEAIDAIAESQTRGARGKVVIVP